MKQSSKWMQIFDRDDLIDFIEELLTSYDESMCTCEDDNRIQNIIHEWYESSLAIQSGVLDEALNDKTDEVELTKPLESFLYLGK